jgi:hypothetical protein
VDTAQCVQLNCEMVEHTGQFRTCCTSSGGRQPGAAEPFVHHRALGGAYSSQCEFAPATGSQRAETVAVAPEQRRS